ncbi:hypothetical protein B296_00036821 [Ensete ventricosum]|uniref:Uncharacterized protein n=1 Tax=Ensete ventricosum TaxID=4639 RepID=A0A427A1D7_ENSVE|nr:hypothetical protein B296_00036821 [Ensete ventricosum]
MMVRIFQETNRGKVPRKFQLQQDKEDDRQLAIKFKVESYLPLLFLRPRDRPGFRRFRRLCRWRASSLTRTLFRRVERSFDPLIYNGKVRRAPTQRTLVPLLVDVASIQPLCPIPRLLSPVGCVPRLRIVNQVRYSQQGQVPWSRVGPTQGACCFPALLEMDEHPRRVSIYRV